MKNKNLVDLTFVIFILLVVLPMFVSASCPEAPQGWCTEDGSPICKGVFRGWDSTINNEWNYVHSGECSLRLDSDGVSTTITTSHTLSSVSGGPAYYTGLGGELTYYVWVYIPYNGTARLSVSSESVSTSIHSQWVLLTLTAGVSTFISLSYTGDSRAYFDDVRIEKSDAILSYNPTNIMTDYGFVSDKSNVRQYMCYDRSIQPLAEKIGEDVIAEPSWLNALQVKYRIFTVDTPSGKTDTISNSNEWYYCNANSRSDMGGIPIPENGTFVSVLDNGNVFCKDIMSLAFSTPDNPVTFTDCPSYNADNCCIPPGKTTTADAPGNCNGACIYNHKVVVDICAFSGVCPTSGTGSVDNTGLLIPKDSCSFDLSGCLNDTTSNPALDCIGQDVPGFNSELCAPENEICLNGSIIKTNDPSENGRCCFGKYADCKSVPSPTSKLNCTLMGGKPYTVDSHHPDYVSCATHLNILGDPDGAKCCFSGLSYKIITQLGFVISNSSFLCSKENGQNILSDCCYDKSCPNVGLMNNLWQKQIYSMNRVQTLGGATHTINNFDAIRDGVIVDLIQKESMISDHFIKIDRDEPSDLDMSNFSYLEFDIAYTSQLNMTLRDGVHTGVRFDFGPLAPYLTNGDQKMRWHHAVIPLHGYDPEGNYYSLDGALTQLAFTVEEVPSQLVIDNIILTPGIADLVANSPNQYCTGGFEGWITDLDPPSTFTAADLKSWDKIGPYMLTCNSQGAFGWTGSRCCGDDTKLTNYGEFYNDTLFACFNGTIVKDGWSLGYAKNYYESGDAGESQLQNYKYSGVTYYNSTFVGCQVPSHDLGLNVSINGTDIDGKRLVTNFVDSQCEMKGDYYCMNGIWRSVISDGTKEGMPVKGMSVQLKTLPAGPDLIQTGFKSTDNIHSPSCYDPGSNALCNGKLCGTMAADKCGMSTNCTTENTSCVNCVVNSDCVQTSTNPCKSYTCSSNECILTKNTSIVGCSAASSYVPTSISPTVDECSIPADCDAVALDICQQATCSGSPTRCGYVSKLCGFKDGCCPSGCASAKDPDCSSGSTKLTKI